MSKSEPVVCPECGQSADNRPGIRLLDNVHRETHLRDDTPTGSVALTALILVCNACQHKWVTHEPVSVLTEPVKADDYGYATTGAINSRQHVARYGVGNTEALCGTGIVEVNEYRPSHATLVKSLCPKCRRLAAELGIDPFTLGWRGEAND